MENTFYSDKNVHIFKNKISQEHRDKANGFLNDITKNKLLFDIIEHLKKCLEYKQSVVSSVLALEVIFNQLLKRRDLLWVEDIGSSKSSEFGKNSRDWLYERYEEVWSLILGAINIDDAQDSSQALVTCMNLLVAEGKYPLNTKEAYKFPRHRLRRILEKLISSERVQTAAIESFENYVKYLDVIQNCWKILSNFVQKSTLSNENAVLNCLKVLQNLSVTDELREKNHLLCPLTDKASGTEQFNYVSTRKCINKIWNNLILLLDTNTPESVHRQMLILLLECILPHIENPVLLTDFLMDSLDCGGAISLLALQGVFTLIQKHNITYPNIYEKLYSMFEPEIFHTKFKARLFYLADIFLSSTHLPENLVAAFLKRLARLSLISPPQDAIIILYFIGNLILRHTGLKSLINNQQHLEVTEDPFIMDERDPTKSNAINSSLWEVVLLQKHSIPSVASAARLISQPLPKEEWDLQSVLEFKEDDIFEQEINKQSKMYAPAFERPQNLFLEKNDSFEKHWNLFN